MDVTTIDVTNAQGSDTFPLQSNDPYVMVETLASQTIRSVKNTNVLEDAFYEYEVDKGSVIEEAVIKMAEKQAFDKDDYSRAPKDADVLVKYFNNYETAQYQTTTRLNDVRKILKEDGNADTVVAQIIDTITQGEDNADFEAKRDAILNNDNLIDYSTIIGGDPASMKGVIFAMRNAYDHLKSNNADLTKVAYKSSTPVDDIRIVIPDVVMNLIDVVELANIFNLSKEEIFGKIIVCPVSDFDNKYKVVVYDRKAFGRATRLYEYTQERIAKGLYYNHYLTTERAYFYNGLFKATSIDCTKACESALANLISQE